MRHNDKPDGCGEALRSNGLTLLGEPQKLPAWMTELSNTVYRFDFKCTRLQRGAANESQEHRSFQVGLK